MDRKRSTEPKRTKFEWQSGQKAITWCWIRAWAERWWWTPAGRWPTSPLCILGKDMEMVEDYRYLEITSTTAWTGRRTAWLYTRGELEDLISWGSWDLSMCAAGCCRCSISLLWQVFCSSLSIIDQIMTTLSATFDRQQGSLFKRLRQLYWLLQEFFLTTSHLSLWLFDILYMSPDTVIYWQYL